MVPATDGLEQGSTPVVDRDNPWPGLASYGEEDREYFFGRSYEADALVRLVQRERLTVLYGLSGLGKTSLLHAGVFPALREADMLPVSVRLVHEESAPPLGDQVLDALDAAAAGAGVEIPEARPGESLWEYLHRKGHELWGPRNRLVTPLFVFDQFEEIFTLGRATPQAAERSALFLSELGDLIEGRPPSALRARLEASPGAAADWALRQHDYKVLLSLREDFLADLDDLRPAIPSLVHNRLRLLRLSGEQALDVVTRAGRYLLAPDETAERGVAGRIVAFVGAGVARADVHAQPTAELEIDPALLSLVCSELNRRRRERGDATISAELVAGERRGILDAFYQSCVGGLAQPVRRLVEDHLVTASGFRDSLAYDNAVSTAGIRAEELEALVRRRLLRLEARGGVARLELTHDVLVDTVRRSRDARQAREAAEQREAGLRAQQERERAARRAAEHALRRTRLVAAVIVVLGILAAASAWLAWRSARSLRAASALMFLRQGTQELEHDNARAALAYFAAGLRQDATVSALSVAAVDVLQRRTWPRPLVEVRHTDWVLSVVFSPDGRRIVTTADDHSARVWDSETGRPLTAPMRHTGRVSSAAFSPDGQRVVTASGDKTARVWDALTGQLLTGPLKHTGAVYSAAFSPDGQRVVTASSDNSARVWDPRKGTLLTRPLQHEDEVLDATFSPQGLSVVTASADHSARVWDCRTGACLAKQLRHADRVVNATFSPDGLKVATSSADGSARVWDSRSGEALTPPLKEGGPGRVVFSPDGRRLATASGDAARVWDVTTGQPLNVPMRHGGSGYVSSVAFSPDGRRIATASLDHSVRVWDTRNGRALTEPLRHGDHVWSATFSPDGTHVLTASADRTARLWDVRSGQRLTSRLEHANNVWNAMFSRDGLRVVTASDDNCARVWDARTGQALTRPLMHAGAVRYAAFSPDGLRVVTASDDKSARVWDARTGQALTRPLMHAGAVRYAAFSPDGLQVLTASDNNSARVWDALTGQLFSESLKHAGVVRSATFSLDGLRIVTASADNSARVWNALTGQPISESLKHTRTLSSAAFSPDGLRVVTASEDSTAQVWNALTGQPISASLKHEGIVRSAAFSPDGLRVVTASDDNSARVWDTRTGESLTGPLKHADIVWGAAFSPDGQRVVTASSDKSAHVWDVLVPSNYDAAFLIDLAEAVAGVRVTGEGALVPVTDQLVTLARLQQEGAMVAPGKATARSFARWFFADRWERTISPRSSETVPEYIRRRVAEDDATALLDLRRDFAGHPALQGAGAGASH